MLRIATFRPLVLTRRAEPGAVPPAGPGSGHMSDPGGPGTDLRAQALDHRGNFFRLPHNGTMDQNDAESAQGLTGSGCQGQPSEEESHAFDRGKAAPLGILLLKGILPFAKKEPGRE